MASNHPRAVAPFIAVALTCWGGAAYAQTPGELAASLKQVQDQVTAQADRLSEQDRMLHEQQLLLEKQNAEIQRLRAWSDQAMMAARGLGLGAAPDAGSSTPITQAQAGPGPVAPHGPVGEAPPEQPRVEVAALPENAGVLTRRGHWVVEPSVDYTHGSSNRLVFRGVEIVTGIQIGVIEASDADRDTIASTLSARYGLTNRIELELRAPWLYRSDRVTTLAQRDETISRTYNIKGRGIGDLEGSIRYQLNSGAGGMPVLLGGLRVKSDTGKSPFEIGRDEFGISSSLATGSGFWGVEPSLTFLYPNDPAVIFGGVSYLAHLSKNIDRQIGDVFVGKVNPGDSVGVNFGFGFALNSRYSFSLAYKHNYIFKTKTELGNTLQTSPSLQVGSFSLGMSFRLNDRITLSNTYEIGTTRDAPDMRVSLRVPYRF